MSQYLLKYLIPLITPIKAPGQKFLIFISELFVFLFSKNTPKYLFTGFPTDPNGTSLILSLCFGEQIIAPVSV